MAVETPVMAKRGRKPGGQGGSPLDPLPNLISIRGTQAQIDWLESRHRETMLQKATIIRVALNAWAQQNGYPAFPDLDETR